MGEQPIFALSVRQPWAWCIIHAGKHLENRTQGALNHMPRSVTHLAIHASKGMTQDEYEDLIDHPGLKLPSANGAILPRPDELVRGAIIGFVRVIDRVSDSNSHWWCGPRALVLADPVAVEPIPSVGALGYFKWTRGGEIDRPKPWMTSWPNRTPQTRRFKAAMPTEQIDLLASGPTQTRVEEESK